MKQDLAQIEQFLDALWLERNLAENTLSAYRRDLTMLVEWLHHRGLSLASVGSDFHAPGEWSELGLHRPLPEDLSPLWARFDHDNSSPAC